jgi:hypothetical protein
MFKKILLVITVLAVALGLASAPAALAAGTPTAPEITFFSGGTGIAQWATTTPAPPGATDDESMQLQVQATAGDDYNDYAGVKFSGLEGAPPATAPSFSYLSNRAGGSGGSPRLVMSFSDGGSADLRPLTLTAGSWVDQSGSGNDWDNNGGSCGFLYETTYAAVLGCHAGATVTAVRIINDSGWAFAPNVLDLRIDNVNYGAATITHRLGTKLTAEPIVARVLPNLYVSIGQLRTRLTTTDGTPIVGRTVTFKAGGTVLCTAVTDANGVGVCSGLGPWLQAILGLGYTAEFAGDGTYGPATARGPIIILLGISILP